MIKKEKEKYYYSNRETNDVKEKFQPRKLEIDKNTRRQTIENFRVLKEEKGIAYWEEKRTEKMKEYLRFGTLWTSRIIMYL